MDYNKGDVKNDELHMKKNAKEIEDEIEKEIKIIELNCLMLFLYLLECNL